MPFVWRPVHLLSRPAGAGAPRALPAPAAPHSPQPRCPRRPRPQAAQTDQIVAEGEGDAKNGSGAPAPAGAEPVVVGDLAAVQASLEAQLNGNGHSNGNGASHGSNGNGAAKLNGNGATLASASIDAAEGVEGFMPPEEAGQLETAAQVGSGCRGILGAGGAFHRR